MKKMYLIVVMVLGFMLAGCEKDEVRNPNRDVSNNSEVRKAFNDPAQMEQMYGKVIHEGKVASKVMVQGIKMSPTTAGVNLVVPDKANPMIISLICDSRMGTWAISHSLTVNGQAPREATEVSIMNYPNGITQIREADDTSPVFSTSNGDINIAEGLLKIAKLDPNSTVAIVLDRQGADGYYEGEAWSYLMPVGLLAEQLQRINLDICLKSPLQPDESPEIVYTSIDDIRKAAAKSSL